MAKTYEVVVYDDDGKGVTCAITEYDRVDGGHLAYVGRAWYDVEETAQILACITGTPVDAYLHMEGDGDRTDPVGG